MQQDIITMSVKNKGESEERHVVNESALLHFKLIFFNRLGEGDRTQNVFFNTIGDCGEESRTPQFLSSIVRRRLR